MKTLRLYRKTRYSKGYGVHSPFVFSLITKVIREKSSFYCFKDIELIRKRLLQREETITFHDPKRKGKERETTLAQVVKKRAISPAIGALLFRLANHFKVDTVVQIGSNMGISTLYLTSYKEGVSCYSFESVPAFASIAEWVYKQTPTHATKKTIIGDYKTTLLPSLKEIQKADLFFFEASHEQIDTLELFTSCKAYADEKSIFIINGIRQNKKRYEEWKEICHQPDVTVTIDLRHFGIVFLNPRLHKKKYNVYF